MTLGTDGDCELWTFISGRRRFDPGIDQRVPFISDPWAEFEGTRSDGDSVLQTWVQMPVDQIDFGFQMFVIRVQAEALTLCLETHNLTSHVHIICIIAYLFSKNNNA